MLRNLERNLKLVIFGQDKAVEALASAIKMARSGLGDQRKPVGSFLFAGPTGVGKTEVTRQLAIVWASSSCASTCPSTWSGTRFRA
jgi:ATP-dependent Clp protease ATP-binding subunit ClpA